VLRSRCRICLARAISAGLAEHSKSSISASTTGNNEASCVANCYEPSTLQASTSFCGRLAQPSRMATARLRSATVQRN
jgi:hypothetical protein